MKKYGIISSILFSITLIASILITSCSDDDGISKKRFTIGGTIEGLRGSVALQLKQANSETANEITTTKNGSFQFDQKLRQNSEFSISVKKQPHGQSCAIYNQSGIVSLIKSNIIVICSGNQYTIGGTISGLTSGDIELQLYDGLTKTTETFSKNGSFTLYKKIGNGLDYTVTVNKQPDNLTCSMSHNTGKALSNIGDIQIVCNENSYTIGGTVDNLDETIVLQNNGTDDLIIESSGSFSFSGKIAHGAFYNITVKEQPETKTCVVNKGSGTASSAIDNIQVICTERTYPLGGTVSGHTSGNLYVQLDSGSGSFIKLIKSDGTYNFDKRLGHGAEYKATVIDSPGGLTCTSSNNKGYAIAPINDLDIHCSTNTHTVGGSISGLNGTVVLQNNNADDLTIQADSDFTFPARLAYGSNYTVSIKTQPANQTCTVNNNTGIIENNINTVTVTCSTDTYTISGSLSGVKGTIVIQNNGSDYLVINNNGDFQFNVPIASGSGYNVSVRTKPAYQPCSVANGRGTATANISNISVTCGKRYIVLYTPGAFSGSFPGISGSSRERVDKYCGRYYNPKPAGFSRYKGFISISEHDEIRDMPAMYLLPTDVRIVGPAENLIAYSWSDLLDGSISTGLFRDIMTSYYWWSGSDQYGALNTAQGNCNGWTTSDSNVTGAKGWADKTNSSWINYTSQQSEKSDGSCDEKLQLLCVAFDTASSGVGGFIMGATKHPNLIIIVIISIIMAISSIVGIRIYKRKKS